MKRLASLTLAIVLLLSSYSWAMANSPISTESGSKDKIVKSSVAHFKVDAKATSDDCIKAIADSSNGWGFVPPCEGALRNIAATMCGEDRQWYTDFISWGLYSGQSPDTAFGLLAEQNVKPLGFALVQSSFDKRLKEQRLKGAAPAGTPEKAPGYEEFLLPSV